MIITPRRSLKQIQKEALKASPPMQFGQYLPTDLVEIGAIPPYLKLDIRYAAVNNFLGIQVYKTAKPFLQRAVGKRFSSAVQQFRKKGYGVIVYDAYRPWFVTYIFWEAMPDDKRIYVADHKEGSMHNRGCAVDMSLFDVSTGELLDMGGDYDEFSQRSHPLYTDLTSTQSYNRKLLSRVMKDNGFLENPYEWWHFDYKEWERYEIMNIPL